MRLKPTEGSPAQGASSLHSYRRVRGARDLVHFRVLYKQTDLWVGAVKNLEAEALDLVLEARYQVETYLAAHSGFAVSLEPLPPDPLAPPLVQEMLSASAASGVGPMASVAGAIAGHVGEGLLRYTPQVIVENGGDIFMEVSRPATVKLLAGPSPLSGRLGLRIRPDQTPLGIGASSGRVGHSLSLGRADLACLLSPSPALADAAATAVGNRVSSPADLERAARWAREIPGLVGGVIVLGKALVTWGDVELMSLG